MSSYRSNRLGGTASGRHPRPLLGLRTRARVIAATLVSGLVTLSLPIQPASAATVQSASFSGARGTVTVGDTLFAQSGAGITLTVTTIGAKCVIVTGAHSATQEHSNKSTWTFSFTAVAGDGNKEVTATAYEKASTSGPKAQPCDGKSESTKAYYSVDDTGPTVTAALSPVGNNAGWHKADVGITWSASDAGSGMIGGSASGPTPANDTVAVETSGVTKSATAKDALGNSRSNSVVVRLDKTLPVIDALRTPANGFGWNNSDVTVNFTCTDPGTTASGIKSCAGPVTVSREGGDQTVTGKAVDVADNEASVTVRDINIDTTAPVVTGAATTPPNGQGWYNGDVAIAWTCSDALSGLAGACPSASSITGQGGNLGATSPSSSDKAGNAASGSVTGIKIDRTAPNTTATAPETAWNNTDVKVELSAFDALSDVDETYYKLNGGAPQTGTSVAFSAEGTHSLEYWSVDKAGNVEDAKTVTVKIDKTKPSINHSQDPTANRGGWNNTNVTVTFTCEDNDGGSGIASCTDPVTVTDEGKNQPVPGRAVDNAGNEVSAPATVSIDKTVPTISATADREPNLNGWYKDDVTVSFTCDDSMSGITAEGCPAAQTLGQGANQSADGTATDAAGNTASASKGGINVDKTAPTLTGAPQGTSSNGWYNDNVIVKWTCSDEGGSGIDGDCPANNMVTGEGEGRGTNASVSDKAGNSTNANVAGINIDRTAPTTEAKVPPATNGWHPGSVKVTLAATDYLSQVDATYYRLNNGEAQRYTGPIALITTRTHSITFWSVDKAGNVEGEGGELNTITVQVDNTKPSILGSVSPDPDGSNGWYVTAPIVSFSCDDLNGSGIETCLADGESTSSTTLTEGTNQSVSGTATDLVGNTDQASVTGINVDLSDPFDITFVNGPDAGVTYRAEQVPAEPTCTAEDAISGFGSCTVTGYKTEVGTHIMTATAIDKAGREASAQRTYTVAAASWTANGYYRPVDMSPKGATATEVVWNTAKNGSTIPFKFEVFAGPGETNEVTDTSKIAMSVKTISCSPGGTEEAVELLASGSTTLRYDTTGGQFVYNWKTPTKANTCYKVIMTTTEGGAVIDNAFIRLR